MKVHLGKSNSAEEAADRLAEQDSLGTARGKIAKAARHTVGIGGKGKKQKRTERPIKGFPTATVEVPATVIPLVHAPATTIQAPVPIPVKIFQEETTMKGMQALNSKAVANRIQGTFSLKPIWPQVQAVVDRIMNDLPTLPDGIRVRKDLKKNRTILTIQAGKNGSAVIPSMLGIVPSSWNMSLGVERRLNEAAGVCYLKNGHATWLKPYFTLNREKDGNSLPSIDLYGFCSTQGPTQYGYVLQVSKDKEAMITKWAIRVDSQDKATRQKVEEVLHEKLPLQDKARTEAALPVLIKDFGGVLCEIYKKLTTPAPAATPTADSTTAA